MKRFLAILLCLCLLLPLLGCQTEELQSPGTFYYYRVETAYSGTDGVIAPEVRELSGIREDLGAILALYCQGPQSKDLEVPIPQGTPVPGYALEDGVLTLQFDTSFAALTGIELTVAAGCFARTFLPLTGAQTLVLTADGALLDGQSALTVTLGDLDLRDDSQDRLHGDFTVCYTDADRRYLIAQSCSVDLTAREELPALLLERMRTAPTGTALRSVLPAACRVLAVSVEDGLCTVDLSAAFESSRFYDHTGQLLSIMGIVNTLTALPEIEQVELRVEGDPLVRYGALSISGRLEYDERFLGPVRTGLGEWDATVYLVQGGEAGLVPLPTRLRQTGALPQAELMMRSLLSDTGLNGLSTCIPEGTRLNSITLKKRVCHVDLSAEYLSSPDTLLWANRVIAASLCTLDTVSAVSITVDGSVPEGYEPGMFGVLTPKNDWFL